MDILLHKAKLIPFQPIINQYNRINNNNQMGFKSSFATDSVKINKPDEFKPETYSYLTTLNYFLSRNYLNPKDIRLPDIDPYKISDICNGIDVFNGWNAKDLMLMGNNLYGISLSKGCYNQCVHCYASANKKVSLIEWNNYKDLVDGMKKVMHRLFFNPFIPATEGALHPFFDSDPFAFRSVDSKTKEVHGIYDAIKYLYDNTNIKSYLTTAGWEKENKISQKSAKNIAKDPSRITFLTISIHPFHIYMNKSIEFLKKGDTVQANFWRNKYIDMMANVLETLAPLTKINKLGICLEFDYSNKLQYCSQNDAKTLLSDILDKIRMDTPAIYSIYFDNTFSKDKNMEFRDITPIGRAKTLLKSDWPERIPQYTIDSLDAERIYNLPKIILPDGTVLVSLNQVIAHNQFAALPKKLNFKNPTNWKSDINYPTIKESKLIYKVPDKIKERDKEIAETYSELIKVLVAKFKKNSNR